MLKSFYLFNRISNFNGVSVLANYVLGLKEGTHEHTYSTATWRPYLQQAEKQNKKKTRRNVTTYTVNLIFSLKDAGYFFC